MTLTVLTCFKQDKSQEEHEKNVGNLLKKQSKKRKNLEKLGITYDFPGYVSK